MGIKIEKIIGKYPVYDVKVKNNENFYANDILVHNCAEIFQATTKTETAICTLSALILKSFVKNKKFDYHLLYEKTKKIVSSLNKVIDINHYSTEKGRKGGLEQRALAIGIQGLADVFFLMDLPFISEKSRETNKKIFETIYFAAVEQSMELCRDGKYEPYKYFKGSPMSKGIFQFDMWEGTQLSGLYDWDKLKEDVKKYGICNSLFTSIVPTASCQTKNAKIRTSEGIKNFYDILKLNEIDYNLIENNNLEQTWYDFKNPILVETLSGLEKSERIFYNGKVPIFKIEMEDGTIFECSENHKFLIKTENGNIWIESKFLKENDDIINIFESQ